MTTPSAENTAGLSTLTYALPRWMQKIMPICTSFRTIGCPAGRVLIPAVLLLLYGCAGDPDSTAAGHRTTTGPVVRNDTLHSDGGPTGRLGGQPDDPAPVATLIDARPAALINGRQINWGELRPLLNEAAGADVLEEVILDSMLQRQIDEAGIIITDADIRRERDLLLRTMSDDPNVARRVLEQVRNRRGLGVRRFDRLLERNARLRALVADRVNVTDEQVRRLYEVTHGPKRQARLMMLPDLSMAQQAIQRVREGRSFADVAVEWSTDQSAARGGLLEPISRQDARYPSALREELWSLQVGEISTPVLLENQYAVIQLVRTVAADDVAFDDVQSDLRRTARINQQRILMDELVERIMADVSVTIFDESLREAWKRREQRP